MRRLEKIPGGWKGTAATIKRMHQLAAQGKTDWTIVKVASVIVRGCQVKDYNCAASRIFGFVKRKIEFRLDPHQVELIQHPLRTLERKAGDCDDHAILLAALAGAIGIPYAFKTIKADTNRPNDFSHVYTVFAFPGQDKLVAADTTVGRSTLGWEPPGNWPFQIWHEPNIDTLNMAGLGNNDIWYGYPPEGTSQFNASGMQQAAKVKRIADQVVAFMVTEPFRVKKQANAIVGDRIPMEQQRVVYDPIQTVRPGELDDGYMHLKKERYGMNGMGTPCGQRVFDIRPAPPSGSISVPENVVVKEPLTPRVPELRDYKREYAGQDAPVPMTRYRSMYYKPVDGRYMYYPLQVTGQLRSTFEPGMDEAIRKEALTINRAELMAQDNPTYALSLGAPPSRAPRATTLVEKRATAVARKIVKPYAKAMVKMAIANAAGKSRVYPPPRVTWSNYVPGALRGMNCGEDVEDAVTEEIISETVSGMGQRVPSRLLRGTPSFADFKRRIKARADVMFRERCAKYMHRAQGLKRRNINLQNSLDHLRQMNRNADVKAEAMSGCAGGLDAVSIARSNQERTVPTGREHSMAYEWGHPMEFSNPTNYSSFVPGALRGMGHRTAAQVKATAKRVAKKFAPGVAMRLKARAIEIAHRAVRERAATVLPPSNLVDKQFLDPMEFTTITNYHNYIPGALRGMGADNAHKTRHHEEVRRMIEGRAIRTQAQKEFYNPTEAGYSTYVPGALR